MNTIRDYTDSKKVCLAKSSVCIVVVLVVWMQSRKRKDRFGIQGIALG